MSGSGGNTFDHNDDAAPDFSGVPSLLEQFGLRMVEVPDKALRVRHFILSDDGVIARIEQADDGSLAWFGHWRGGTNAGTAETSNAVVQAVVRHFRRMNERTPWRSLAWPSAMVEAVR